MASMLFFSLIITSYAETFDGTIVSDNATVPELLASRIYMEDPATQRFPFMVAIKSGNSVLCGGTLVDEQNIVTAAHCVLIIRTDTDITVVLGAYDLRKNDSGSPERHLTECWIPKLYKPGHVRSRGDIGVCRLDKPVKFTKTVDRICISRMYVHKIKVALIGYGRIDGINVTSYLQYAAGTTRLNKECHDSIKRDQVCARLRNMKGRRVEQAHGDSGGPLFSKATNGKYNLIGVVTYNYDFAADNGPGSVPDFGIPGVYTRASSFVGKFLKKYAQIDTNCKTAEIRS